MDPPPRGRPSLTDSSEGTIPCMHVVTGYHHACMHIDSMLTSCTIPPIYREAVDLDRVVDPDPERVAVPSPLTVKLMTWIVS